MSKYKIAGIRTKFFDEQISVRGTVNWNINGIDDLSLDFVELPGTENGLSVDGVALPRYALTPESASGILRLDRPFSSNEDFSILRFGNETDVVEVLHFHYNREDLLFFTKVPEGTTAPDTAETFASFLSDYSLLPAAETGPSVTVDVAAMPGVTVNDALFFDAVGNDLDTTFTQTGGITAYIGDGFDQVTGTAFDDRIIGNEGRKLIDSGDGDDLIRLIGDVTSSLIQAGRGDDTIDLREASHAETGFSASTVLGDAGNDTIYGSEIDDIIFAGTSGSAQGDWVHGNGGDDSITLFEHGTARGGLGNDFFDAAGSSGGITRLFGGDGNDTFHLGSEQIYAHGDAGDDEFFFFGADVNARGGTGADTFTFNGDLAASPTSHLTRLHDFTPGEDLLHFQGFSGNVATNVANATVKSWGLRIDLDNGALIALMGVSDPLNSGDFAVL